MPFCLFLPHTHTMRLAGGVEIDRFHALELLDDLLHYMKG